LFYNNEQDSIPPAGYRTLNGCFMQTTHCNAHFFANVFKLWSALVRNIDLYNIAKLPIVELRLLLLQLPLVLQLYIIYATEFIDNF